MKFSQLFMHMICLQMCVKWNTSLQMCVGRDIEMKVYLQMWDVEHIFSLIKSHNHGEHMRFSQTLDIMNKDAYSRLVCHFEIDMVVAWIKLFLPNL